MCVHAAALWTVQTFVYWAVIMLNCDWHSCFRAMRAVMWLAERLFNNHHTHSSIFTFIQPFPTLRCCTYMNQNSRCALRPAPDLTRCPWHLLLKFHIQYSIFNIKLRVQCMLLHPSRTGPASSFSSLHFRPSRLKHNPGVFKLKQGQQCFQKSPF